MVKIYLAQMQPVLCNKVKNLEKIHSFIQEASRQHADIVLFPELALTGFSTEDNTMELAETIDGSSVSNIRNWAKEFNIKVVFGFPEMVNGKVYNAACFINHDGALIGVHKKAHLWGEEGKYYHPGNSFHVWETDVGKIGIMICFDTQFPESARLLALKGAEIILVPTGNMSPFESLQPFNIRSRAEENQVFVCTTNLVGVEGPLNFFGESMASDPFGKVLVKAGQSESGVMVHADIDKVKEARESYNYLANRRPELYQDLTVKSLK